MQQREGILLPLSVTSILSIVYESGCNRRYHRFLNTGKRIDSWHNPGNPDPFYNYIVVFSTISTRNKHFTSDLFIFADTITQNLLFVKQAF